MKRTFSLVFISLFLFAAQTIIGQTKKFIIRGKATSFEESLALEGVSIHIKGTKYYTGTQADGTFSLDASSDQKTLVFELKDYETIELPISEKKEYNVILKRSQSPTRVISREASETVIRVPVKY